MNRFLKFIVVAIAVAVATPLQAQFNLKKAIGGAAKAAKAMTLTDAQMADYVKESVEWMDTHNKVSDADSPYTQRLNRLTANLKEAGGLPLNFKVYEVIDINAFACPDGSVRVFSSLMDIMSDDELLGVIGHEIGHVAMHHSKNAFRTSLLTDALKDGVASTGAKAAALTESQLGTVSSSLINARFSQKQENEADDAGYEFLKTNGVNPWGMVKAFEKLSSLEGDAAKKQSYINKMFSSHPETQKRIARMSQRATADGFARPE